MTRPIPPSKWVWCGYAGHFIAASRCVCHLNTRVGDYRISTVGDYRPDGEKRDTVGLNRWGETYVFRVGGKGYHGEGVVEDWGEIDSRGYSETDLDDGTIERGHFEMCRKYARIAVGLEEVPA